MEIAMEQKIAYCNSISNHSSMGCDKPNGGVQSSYEMVLCLNLT